IERARLIKHLPYQAPNASCAEPAPASAPNQPPGTAPGGGILASDAIAAGSLPPAAPRRERPCPAGVRVEKPGPNATHRETAPHPSRPAEAPGKPSVKIPMQRGTVAPPARPAEAPDETFVKTSMQRG